MNQITIDYILLVGVPENSFGFEVGKKNELGYWTNSGLHEKWNAVDIPPGSWQFIGTTDAITEEIARLKDELNNIKSRTYTHAEVNKMLLSISSKCDEEIARLRKAIDRIIFRVSITGMLEEKSVLVQAINEIESIATEALKQ